jgi:hypothetical protein
MSLAECIVMVRVVMVVEDVTAAEDVRQNGDDGQHNFCCSKFFTSRCRSKITEQTSSFTDDKYYCVVDGFGYPTLENILYCPYCGSNLVGH